MLFLLSPAKKLDFDSSLPTSEHTQPLFIKQAQALIKVLKAKSSEDIAQLMSLSPALSDLNVERYHQWKPSFTLENSRQAILAFNGDVYEGLQAQSLKSKQLEWAQEHIGILSGLYGVLRPLDLMQAYRLEMGTKLATPKGKNLYEFWGTEIAQYLNQRLDDSKERIIINLASEEYFKSVNLKTLDARVVQCVFQDEKNGVFKIISFYAKRARGLMARYAIEHKVKKVQDLEGFDYEGYVYDASSSSKDKLVFKRKENK